MAGFHYRKNLDGSAYSPTNLSVTAKASTTYQVGDLIRINTSGTASLVAATEGIAGVVTGVTDVNGLAKTPDSGTTDTWTTASSTTDKVFFIPALPNYLFYNDSSGTLAATNLFQYFDVSDENNVDQSSATDTATAQVRLIEIDPDHDGDASKGLFQIVESQLAQIGVSGAA